VVLGIPKISAGQKSKPSLAVKAHLSQAVGVLAADGPVGRDVEGQIGRRDVVILDELGDSVLPRRVPSRSCRTGR
jgi:hypothetical protein